MLVQQDLFQSICNLSSEALHSATGLRDQDMKLQQTPVLDEEVIDFFLEDLKKSFRTRPPAVIPIEYYDNIFLARNKRRIIGDFWKDSINLSVDFWKNHIKTRMDFYFSHIFLNNPFVSYTENISWLRLAFDIAKKEVADPKE